MLESASLAQFGILLTVFLAASLAVLGVAAMLRRPPLVDRIDAVTRLGPDADAPASTGRSRWQEAMARAVRPLTRLNLPRQGWDESELRLRFVQAGWRGSSAPVLFFGMKTVLGLGLPFAYLLLRAGAGWQTGTAQTMLIIGWLAVVGYYLPNYFLNRRVDLRKREIFETFPDALDLMTICVEAGLGLDAALMRVAREIRLRSKALAGELEMVTLEIRAGSGRDRALRNLALRTGVEDIETLVAMLIQSERFGTSIGESLRIQSDTLRSKRQQRAEEAAAKIAVKLVFPLVLCILPSIFIVAAGPAVLSIGKTFATVFGAN